MELQKPWRRNTCKREAVCVRVWGSERAQACPWETVLIFSALISLLKKHAQKHIHPIICSVCTRRTAWTYMNEWLSNETINTHTHTRAHTLITHSIIDTVLPSSINTIKTPLKWNTFMLCWFLLIISHTGDLMEVYFMALLSHATPQEWNHICSHANIRKMETKAKWRLRFGWVAAPAGPWRPLSCTSDVWTPTSEQGSALWSSCCGQIRPWWGRGK